MPVPLWYGLGAVAWLAVGLFLAYRRLFTATVFATVAATVLFAMSLWTMRRATVEEAFGKPMTKASAKQDVVYEIVGRLDDGVATSPLRTHLIIRERDGDPNDLRLFLYPGRPVSRAFTVEPDTHGIPTARPATDKER